MAGWSGWERISESLWPTSGIPGTPYGLLRFRLEPYRGRAISLLDATTVQHHSLVGQLHCDNRAVLSAVRAGINPFAACREDLRNLAEWTRSDAIGRSIVAFHGLTILAKGAARLGFTVQRRPLLLRRRMQRIFFAGLLVLYSAQGLERLRYGTTFTSYPQEVWISRAELIRRYGGNRARPAPPASSGARWDFFV